MLVSYRLGKSPNTAMNVTSRLSNYMINTLLNTVSNHPFHGGLSQKSLLNVTSI